MKLRGLIVGEVRSIETTGAGRAPGPGAGPGDGGADPGRRQCPPAAQDPVRGALRRPRHPRGGAGAGRSGPATSSGRTAPPWRSSSSGSSRTCCRCCARCAPRSSRPPSTPSPRRSTAAAPAWARTSSSRTPTSRSSTPDADHPGRHLRPRRPCRARMPWRRPELVRAARALITTNATIVQKQESLKGFFAGTAGFANTTADFLDSSGDRIIQAGPGQPAEPGVVRQVLPAVPLHGHRLANWVKNIDGAWKNDTFHITLEITPQRQGYRPGEEPAWGESRGPNCYGLPDQLRQPAEPPPGHHLRRRHEPPGQRLAGSALPSAFTGPAAASRSPTPTPGWPAPRRSSRWSPPCSPGTAPGASRRPSPPCSPGRCCADRW